MTDRIRDACRAILDALPPEALGEAADVLGQIADFHRQRLTAAQQSESPASVSARVGTVTVRPVFTIETEE